MPASDILMPPVGRALSGGRNTRVRSEAETPKFWSARSVPRTRTTKVRYPMRNFVPICEVLRCTWWWFKTTVLLPAAGYRRIPYPLDYHDWADPVPVSRKAYTRWTCQAMDRHKDPSVPEKRHTGSRERARTPGVHILDLCSTCSPGDELALSTLYFSDPSIPLLIGEARSRCTRPGGSLRMCWSTTAVLPTWHRQRRPFACRQISP
jgi:hypothetical protein